MLARIADEAAERFGDRAVVVSPEGILTFKQLAENSARLAAALATRGVGEGDVVALALPSGGDWLVAATAVSRIGAIFAGISPVLTPRERGELQKLVSPRLTLADPSLVDGLSLRSQVAVLDAGSRGAALVAEASDGGDGGGTGDGSTGAGAGPGAGGPGAGGPGAVDYETAKPGPGGVESAVRITGSRAGVVATETPELPPIPPPDPSRPAVICFTSGTTGRAKAALYRERQLQAIQSIDLGPDAEQIWDGGASMLASTQFAHVGMSTKFPWYLRLGCTLHVMPRWRADDALKLVARERMPSIGAVTPQLALMLRSPLFDELDLTCVQTVIAGGAASSVPLVREIRERLGAGYSIRYSSTESGGVGLATDAHSADESEWGTIGRPRPQVQVRITDDSDTPLADGTVGELQLRSPAVMDSYWNDPDATVAALSADGWLRTGDLASIDDHGRVVLAGRRSDMYIRGGYNVFPAEVEAVLLEHDLVNDVVVVPVPDDVMGEVGMAMVVPTDPTRPPTLDDLRNHASAVLASHKLPQHLAVVDQIPLTTAQKVDRVAARRLADEIATAGMPDSTGPTGSRNCPGPPGSGA